MGLNRLGRLVGFLLLVAHFFLGLAESEEFEPPRVVKMLRDQSSEFSLNDPREQSGHPIEVFEESKTHVGKTLYRGFMLRTLWPSVDDINEKLGKINWSTMCFGFFKGSKWQKGFCLKLNSNATFSQISMDFKQDTFILRINEYAIECDWEHRSLEILTFKPFKNRYVLQSYSRVNDSDKDIDPFYAQKRDGKRIYMDAIDNGVLDTLEDHCYKKHDCQTWEEKHGIE
ncbi:hypothetical protein [Helicobacter bizzozeronii]|uniref:hypothetical protein n=1 Tax=Helicobacter bizzozeronii TaxID=56877 RepID=UPI001F43A489|nr:hypothetical protein [Helicobacter bizzozeronii]